MKKIFTVFILIAFIGLSETLAQSHARCGTSYEDQKIILDRLVRNRATYANQTLTRMPVMWTPIKFHIVNKDDGTGGISPIKVYEMMCTLNEYYLDQDIQFYILGDFNYFNNTGVYNDPSGGNGTLLSNRVNNAINIFLTKGIDDVTSGGGTLGYYSPNFDWVVIRGDQVSGAISLAATIIHELGHFFSLAHPFVGWEGPSYDTIFYGNPAPDFDPDNNPTELMDGSNCMQAADMICDTPPSYNFSNAYVSQCVFNESVKDPNGTPVNPDEMNFMDYFIGCSASFTPDQKTAIAMDLASRPVLHTNEDFDVTPLAGTEMISPIDGETTPSFSFVNFEWTEVPGATSYVIEIDRFASFVLDPQVFSTSDNFIEVQGIFDPNKKYFWRVKAIKDGYFCSPTADDSSTGEFRTGTDAGGAAVNEISEIVGYTISPNPLSSNQTLNINLETAKGFDAKIRLFSLSGQVMVEDNTTFQIGTANYEMSVNGLAEGMYILSIETESGVLNDKIVVTK